MARPRKTRRRSWGTVRPSGTSGDRWIAQYTGPDGKRYKAPHTFMTTGAADGWLSEEHKLVDLGVWTPPEQRQKQAETKRITVGEYITDTYLPSIKNDNSRRNYTSIFNTRIANTVLAETSLVGATRRDVNAWYEEMCSTPSPRTGKLTPARDADTYSFLRAAFNHAVDNELIEFNPCRIKRGASKPKPEDKTPNEHDASLIYEQIGEHYKAAVAVQASCALRIGELSELRRRDFKPVHDRAGRLVGYDVLVSRAGDYQAGEWIVGTPKNGSRTVRIHPALVERVSSHLNDRVGPARDALVFPNEDGRPINRRRYNTMLARACERAGVDRITSHSWRHYGATMFARAGGNVKDVQEWLNHATPEQSMHYVNASRDHLVEVLAKTSVLGAGESV